MANYNESLDWAKNYLNAYASLTQFNITPENREKLVPELRNLATRTENAIDKSLSEAEESSIDTTEVRKVYTQLKQKLEGMLNSQ
ncbi:MAG: hypothetical protein WC867_04215 [Candidatus Pacearchaeota archaeon]|jgi:hypothetical protein